MKRLGWFTVLACVLLFSSLTYVVAPAAHTPRPLLAQGKAFDPGCPTLPFEAIKMKRPIDDACPRGGSAASTDPTGAHALENLAKNNFCVKGDPVPVTYNAFVGLQTAVNNMPDLPWGEGTRLPPDRSKLLGLKIKDSGRSLTLGEGTKVVFVGYVMDAKHDDTAKGEDVNCKIPGNESNDIHISLRTVPGAQAAAPKGKPDLRCNSITAEISPHFRPAVWDKFDSAPYRAVFQKYPVRITGTLLFDAAHRPCENGIPSAGNPVRISVWEIHPVYAIDVCKYPTITRCKVGDQSAWTPFDKYKLGS
ncbi:MAG TPA: hypothetical protein VGB76_21185 [Pyrinomonadaceae bacterium]|jgi:hypothetical protein